MEFNQKKDFKSKIKEKSQPKIKQKYNNSKTNYIISNNEKNQSSKSSKSKLVQKPRYFENILKGTNNQEIIQNIERTSNIININQNNINNNDYIIAQLLDKEDDTYEDLKHKNKKLRELIVKISKQLDMLYNKYENIKINAENEKKILLEKFEKISANYKLYAESYKENIKLKKEKDLLANFDDFIFSLKEEFLNNLIQYKNQLDIINYPSFYYEFNLFINEECNYCNYKKNNQISKFQTYKNSNNSTYRQNISLRNEKKENRTTRVIRGNNSYDGYRKYNKQEKDKSPKVNKRVGKKSRLILRQKTPTKSNKYYENLSFNKNSGNNYNFNKTVYNNPKKNASIEDEKNNNIFGDVGNVININRNCCYKK